MIKIQECYEVEDDEEYEILHRYISHEDILRFADWCKFYKDRGLEITEIKRENNELTISFGNVGDVVFDTIAFDIKPRVVRW